MKSGGWRQFPALLACAVMGGCSAVRFYAQAVGGQVAILNGARPVARVTRDAAVRDEVKRKLALVLEVRRFAKERLSLPADRMYDRYTDLGRRYVSWVVCAAPEFSVEGKTWCYPIVGSLKYRGFFSQNARKKGNSSPFGCPVSIARPRAERP